MPRKTRRRVDVSGYGRTRRGRHETVPPYSRSQQVNVSPEAAPVLEALRRQQATAPYRDVFGKPVPYNPAEVDEYLMENSAMSVAFEGLEDDSIEVSLPDDDPIDEYWFVDLSDQQDKDLFIRMAKEHYRTDLNDDERIWLGLQQAAIIHENTSGGAVWVDFYDDARDAKRSWESTVKQANKDTEELMEEAREQEED